MDARSGWATSTAMGAPTCSTTTRVTATGGWVRMSASAGSCSGASRETLPGSARYGTGGPSGPVTSPALIALKRFSTTQEIATGGLAHTMEISCSGALQETLPGSARYGTGGPSGRAILTVTDAPICCLITQEIATGGWGRTTGVSCSGASRETPLGSVR